MPSPKPVIKVRTADRNAATTGIKMFISVMDYYSNRGDKKECQGLPAPLQPYMGFGISPAITGKHLPYGFNKLVHLVRLAKNSVETVFTKAERTVLPACPLETMALISGSTPRIFSMASPPYRPKRSGSRMTTSKDGPRPLSLLKSSTASAPSPAVSTSHPAFFSMRPVTSRRNMSSSISNMRLVLESIAVAGTSESCFLITHLCRKP